ncbi:MULTISPECIES: HNH endonuclease [Pseudomonas]|uniref:HNH endonuclease n=1 Tax=Pseudomonas TaxID=286 RepID=UPI0015B1A4D9|nr:MULTISPECIES: HNH endonuclease [Pseudomonas]MDW3711707.1 HNH endonuclease [Pseudomonas sp. 2023EL-01195]
MGYPFEKNPLDEYLPKLFKLRIEELDATCIRDNSESTKKAKEAAANKLIQLNSEIREITLKFSVPEREIDQFKSKAELAVEKFLLEYPEPSKPDPNCEHNQTQVTKKEFRDGTLHVVAQCLSCGSQARALQKKDYQIGTLPAFDDSLRERLHSEWRHWSLARDAVFSKEINKDNSIPNFDIEAFDSRFQTNDPKPEHEDCKHSNTEARIRTYKNGSTAVVLQCILCGHHTGSASKRNYPAISALPLFDEQLKERCKAALDAWYTRRGNAWRREHEEHHRIIKEKIQSGEIAVKDNSRFGTYYDSPEWERTRTRILQRDDHQCQACKLAAECVHHIVYDRLGAENDIDLISLCNTCHNLIHQEQRKFRNIYRMPPRDIKELHETKWDYEQDCDEY